MDVIARTIVGLVVGGDRNRKDEDEDEDEDKDEDKNDYKVYHIVNPHPIPWSRLLAMVQTIGLASTPTSTFNRTRMEEMSMVEWSRRLDELQGEEGGEEGDVERVAVSGLKLMGFREDMAREGGDRVWMFGTEATVRASGVLGGV